MNAVAPMTIGIVVAGSARSGGTRGTGRPGGAGAAPGRGPVGATADPGALDSWLQLVGGDPRALSLDGPAVPDGLAIKMFPCCYALQRPISAVAALAGQVDPAEVARIVVRTPKARWAAVSCS